MILRLLRDQLLYSMNQKGNTTHVFLTAVKILQYEHDTYFVHKLPNYIVEEEEFCGVFTKVHLTLHGLQKILYAHVLRLAGIFSSEIFIIPYMKKKGF